MLTRASDRFGGHLLRVEPLFAHLRAGGRRDPLVLALLAVETFQRPRRERTGEYAAWAVLSRVAPQRVQRLSVGIAQVQLRHWVRLGPLDSSLFSVRNLRAVRSPGCNYDVCAAYLRDALPGDSRALSDVVRAYTGGQSPRYLALTESALTSLALQSSPPADADGGRHG